MYIVSIIISLSFPHSYAKEAGKFIVGAQDINYFPHYNFTTEGDKGYAWSLLNEFAKQSGYEFIYLALPIKRLQKELSKGTVDFAYPDNPRWSNGNNTNRKKYYSKELVTALGGTMVRPESKGRGIAPFNVLSVPYGFNPVMWKLWIEREKVTVIGVQDARAALQMVRLGRADGADIEYHVARHLSRNIPSQEHLVFDASLPYDFIGFQLSTRKHPKVIQEFNQFLSTHKPLISKLKEKYTISTPEKLLYESKHND